MDNPSESSHETTEGPENEVNKQTKEPLFSLKEIIKLTGHTRTESAYMRLRNRHKRPDGFRPAARAPEGVWRRSVVLEVFRRDLERAATLRGISIDDML